MSKKLWILQFLLLVLHCCLVYNVGGKTMVEEEKAEAINPIMSPPEGNTTFLGGTTWCVARPGASQIDLKIALDWACGLGAADCAPILPNGACFQPDTLLNHASYAFNAYYQQNGNNDVACNFGGTAIFTKHDPSYGKCVYATSGNIFVCRPMKLVSSSSSRKLKVGIVVWLRSFATPFLILSLGSSWL
ncbi:hypothetical protein LIER_43970 [Lithospermum erythrorhizon]|uniref:X8 domain-containing protein n=1 Tax=Lithospermum erythrorhizon TaxID=34254 RepID=A0AAV3RD27_LITER